MPSKFRLSLPPTQINLHLLKIRLNISRQDVFLPVGQKAQEREVWEIQAVKGHKNRCFSQPFPQPTISVKQAWLDRLYTPTSPGIKLLKSVSVKSEN